MNKNKVKRKMVIHFDTSEKRKRKLWNFRSLINANRQNESLPTKTETIE